MKKSLLFICFAILTFSSINAKTPATNEKLIVFHLDFNSVSLSEEYVRIWLKKAANMGYNSVLWEIENEVQWDICPECASPDAFSKDTFKKILGYSRELGLEPIPLLQTMGHAEYVLQNEKFNSLREDSTRYDCYCTTNQEVRIFLKEWIDEYLELFGDIRYFHLGGDEAYAFATCNSCKQRVEEIGENKLYVEHITDISNRLLEKGIRPGIWSDMIMKHPLEIDILDKRFVIWDWNYWDGDSIPDKVMVWGKGRISKENISDSILKDCPEIVDVNKNLNPFYTSDVLIRLGYDVILCSSSRSHGDNVFLGRNELHVDNIIGAARKTIESNLLGNCVTSWAVRVHNLETQVPWLYLAPLTIKFPSLSHKELLAKTSQDLFGVNSTEFFEIATQVGYSFTFANEKSTGIMWTGLKDSKPAPEKYIHDLIDKWKSPTSSNKWNSVETNIKNSTDVIGTGISNLNNYIPKVKDGLGILNAWSKAGYFQYWQSIIANETFNTADGKSGKSSFEMVILLDDLKRDYKVWAETWMTQTSAEQNSGLIYDAIINYFKQSMMN